MPDDVCARPRRLFITLRIADHVDVHDGVLSGRSLVVVVVVVVAAIVVVVVVVMVVVVGEVYF